MQLYLEKSKALDIEKKNIEKLQQEFKDFCYNYEYTKENFKAKMTTIH